jgi:hypothetical protein
VTARGPFSPSVFSPRGGPPHRTRRRTKCTDAQDDGMVKANEMRQGVRLVPTNNRSRRRQCVELYFHPFVHSFGSPCAFSGASEGDGEGPVLTERLLAERDSRMRLRRYGQSERDAARRSSRSDQQSESASTVRVTARGPFSPSVFSPRGGPPHRTRRRTKCTDAQVGGSGECTGRSKRMNKSSLCSRDSRMRLRRYGQSEGPVLTERLLAERGSASSNAAPDQVY